MSSWNPALLHVPLVKPHVRMDASLPIDVIFVMMPNVQAAKIIAKEHVVTVQRLEMPNTMIGVSASVKKGMLELRAKIIRFVFWHMTASRLTHIFHMSLKMLITSNTYTGRSGCDSKC